MNLLCRLIGHRRGDTFTAATTCRRCGAHMPIWPPLEREDQVVYPHVGGGLETSADREPRPGHRARELVRLGPEDDSGLD